MPRWVYGNVLQPTCFSLIQSLLKKQKWIWDLSPCFICCIILEEKYFSCYILLLTKFHCVIVFPLGDIGQYLYCKYFLTNLWHRKFWNETYLYNQATFSIWPKNQNENFIILKTKRAFKMKVFIIFKGFWLKQWNLLVRKMKVRFKMKKCETRKSFYWITSGANVQRCSAKKGFLKIWRPKACNSIKKETLAQGFLWILWNF